MSESPSSESPATRESLLDAAERLFAEAGIAASSVRAITREAGVNLAAVSYHFGSKDGLVREVLRRRLTPLQDERLRRLEALERRHAPDPPPVDAILRAFLHPVARYLGDPGARAFSRLLLRAAATAPRPISARCLGAPPAARVDLDQRNESARTAPRLSA